MVIANNKSKLKISKFYLYTTMSILYVAYIVQTAFETHGQFFPAIVSLSLNKWFGIVLANGLFAVYLLVTTTLFKLCFGKLQANDRRKLNEFVGLHFVDVCMALSYFRGDINSGFAMVLFINGSARLFHHMAANKQDTMEQTGQAPKKDVIRLTLLLSVMFMLDQLYLGFCMGKIMRDGVSVWVLLALEAVTMTLTVAATLMKLLLNQVEAYKGKIWQSKGTLKFYVDIFHEFCSSVTYVVFFAVSVKHQGTIPLHLIRELLFNFRRFYKTIGMFIRYRRMAATLEGKFPDATAEELDVDRHCAICYDEMEDGTKAKKLPCGHCFHYHCLRRWVEKQTACPYCWQELEKKETVGANPAARVPPAAVVAEQPVVVGAAVAGGAGAAAVPQLQDDEALMQAAYTAYMQMHAEAQKVQEKQDADEAAKTKKANDDSEEMENKKKEVVKRKEREEAEAKETTRKCSNAAKKEAPAQMSEVAVEPKEMKRVAPPTANPTLEIPATPVEGIGRKSKLFSQPSTPAMMTTTAAASAASLTSPPSVAPLVAPTRAVEATPSVAVAVGTSVSASPAPHHPRSSAPFTAPAQQQQQQSSPVSVIPPSMSWERTTTKDREDTQLLINNLNSNHSRDNSMLANLDTQSMGGTSSMGGFSTQSNILDLEELNAHQEYQEDIRRAQRRLDERVGRISLMKREGSLLNSARGNSTFSAAFSQSPLTLTTPPASTAANATEEEERPTDNSTKNGEVYF